MPTVLHNNLVDPSSNTWMRTVVLGHDTLEPRPVYTATRSGSPENVTSRQIVEENDLVIAGVISDGEYRTDLYRVDDASSYPVQLTSIAKESEYEVDFSPLLSLFKPTSLVEWMQDISLPGLLPAGIGWDGVSTQYEREKLDDVIYFLDGVDEEFLEKISEAIMYSQSSQIPIQWSNAKTVLPGTSIQFEQVSNCDSRFVVEWSENFEFLHFEEFEPFSGTAGYTKTDPNATRVLLGDVLRNQYGLILQWRLYHLSR